MEHDSERINHTISNKSNDMDLYYYRSTYAPRNFKGYTLRIFDNISSSVNLSSIEIVLKNLIKIKK